jgi:hypothetical protein
LSKSPVQGLLTIASRRGAAAASAGVDWPWATVAHAAITMEISTKRPSSTGWFAILVLPE